MKYKYLQLGSLYFKADVTDYADTLKRLAQNTSNYDQGS